jgi:hypothetical protein
MGRTKPSILVKVQKKDKVVPVHALKAYKENRGTSPLSLNLGTIWS